MLFARLSDGTTARPQPGWQGTCPGCDQRVIPKCGSQIVWHWAHEADGLLSCDPWSEGETEWHLGWKEVALEFGCRVEVTMRAGEERHRADIVRPDGVAIEIQHSPLGEGEALVREAFYRQAGGLIWLFDARERWWGSLEYVEGLYTWENYSETIAALRAPMFWDTPDGLQHIDARQPWRYASLLTIDASDATSAEIFDPAESVVRSTFAEAELRPPSKVWELIGQRCWSCGAAPVTTYQDGSPKFTCHLKDPARHIPRGIDQRPVEVSA